MMDGYIHMWIIQRKSINNCGFLYISTCKAKSNIIKIVISDYSLFFPSVSGYVCPTSIFGIHPLSKDHFSLKNEEHDQAIWNCILEL